MPWLRTSDAAEELACSTSFLKRNRETHGGFLIAEEDYILGASKTAPIVWNTESCRKKFHYRGRRLRDAESAADQLLQELRTVKA